MYDTRFIVEVRLLDSVNRVKKSKILGVWKALEDVPVNSIRWVNEKVYPQNKVEIRINPYSML